MRALLSSLLIVFGGCASQVPTDEPRIASERSALVFVDGGLRVTGASGGARLGATLATCPGGGWAASAPGDDSLFVSSLGVRLRPGRPFIFALDPLPLVCTGAGSALRVVVGGPNNTYTVFPDGGSVSPYTQRIDALDVRGRYLAMGNAVTSGVVKVFPLERIETASLEPATFTSTPLMIGVGSSVSWSSTGDLLVGNAVSRAAGVYLADPNQPDAGRLVPSIIPLMSPDSLTTSDFGRVVLVGNFTTDPGEEYVVAAPAVGRVHIFSSAGVETLFGGPSFGAALALEPTPSHGGLHALWIGEPGVGKVHRFFGGVRATFGAPRDGQDAGFGSALAVDELGVVAIGAPRFGVGQTLLAGAVFEGTIDPGALPGQSAQCVDRSPCQIQGCINGVCVAGVFCQALQPVASSCSTTERCDANSNVCVPTLDGGAPDAGGPDAGAPDAGGPDAGTPDAGATDAGERDAGAPDAGTPDAGATDAGERDAGAPDAGGLDAGATDGGAPDGGVKPGAVYFSTSGCSVSGFPLLLAALALLRPRKAFGRRANH